MLAAGFRTAHIAKEIGTSYNSLGHACFKNGISLRKNADNSQAARTQRKRALETRQVLGTIKAPMAEGRSEEARSAQRDHEEQKRCERQAPIRIPRIERGHSSVIVPPEALEERDRVLNAPRTLVAELMGDPLPGRSALDRMT